MEFLTTKYINELIRKDYLSFLNSNYSDIFTNQNKYINLTENKISEYLGGGYVKLLNSGTSALQIGLLSLGIHDGDEVILPANTYSATAIAITNIGAIPVFADIVLDNYTIDYNSIEQKITPKTKAIIPVHLYGYAAHMNNILKVAKKYNLKVIEDTSHGFGGEYYGKKLGTLSDIGIFSCHLSKNFGTFGNGGIFYTKDKGIYDEMNNFIHPDLQNKKILKSGRTPANMHAMDAIVLLIKLKYIDAIIDYNLNLYNKYIVKYKDEGFIFPTLNLNSHKLHIRNLVVLSLNRDIYINKGLGKQFYNINLSNNGVFGENIYLKNTEKFFKENLALNFYFGNK